jgi:hypothetical protein
MPAKKSEKPAASNPAPVAETPSADDVQAFDGDGNPRPVVEGPPDAPLGEIVEPPADEPPRPSWPVFVGYVVDGLEYPAIETPAGLVVFGLPDAGAAELRKAD